MNANEIAWVSGWASDISIWENRIYEHFPNFSHRFVDYFDLLPNPDEFWDDNRGLGEAGVVVGWSMGTLAILRNLHKIKKEQKLVLICPIADFCAEGCWQPSALRATKQGVLQNTEQTLMSFSALMGNMEKTDREKWVENAMRYSPKQLATGLDYLMQKKADVSGSYSNVKFVFGGQDKIVPLAQKELFSSHKESIVVCEELGHWLLDYFQKKPKNEVYSE
ncbi:MAG: alpha/beta hydrolase [Fibromonadaceae bacterium]|jgi:pimeloyl-ACP methyl ester carboxylesterase|nr:alpha/beta hydrolase [Fibromonadaceae bacterium]